MISAELPSNEKERLARLRSLNVLDSSPQATFDDITQLASAICGTPVALISLVDEGRQWFKAKIGLDAAQESREHAFCAHAILDPNQFMEVPDATQDLRFHDNPFVVGEPRIRFYAGAPIVTAEGLALGTVCVIGPETQRLTETQRRSLQSLSRQVMRLLEQESDRHFITTLEETQVQGESQYILALSKCSLELKSYIDKDYVYRFVNDIHLAYWGRKRASVINLPVSELMDDNQFQNIVKPRLARAMAGHVVSYQALFDFPKKGKRHVEVAYLPSRDENNVVVGVVVRVIDIEPLKQQEIQLQDTISRLELKKMEQERFIHMISHDLREPVNTINNFSGLMSEEGYEALSSPNKTYLGLVQNSGKRMSALLDDLARYFRLEKLEVAIEQVDLSTLIDQVKTDLAVTFERVDGRLDHRSLPTVLGDKTLLYMLFRNLIENALKFRRREMPPNIIVSASHTPVSILIDVKDNGLGIPPEQLKTIFEVFKRLHLRRQFDGTGLGLSICQRVAHLHGGRVTVTSQLGVGSCFTLEIPKTQTAWNEDSHIEQI